MCPWFGTHKKKKPKGKLSFFALLSSRWGGRWAVILSEASEIISGETLEIHLPVSMKLPLLREIWENVRRRAPPVDLQIVLISKLISSQWHCTCEEKNQQIASQGQGRPEDH